MTKEEKRNICDNIFEYIKEDLSEWLDDEIFVKTSMEQLGELYYKHTQSTVVNATEELLNAVIRTISPKNVEYNNQTDYYCALCNILHIKELPSLKMINVEKEYEEVFEQKYNLLLTKYQAEMNRDSICRRYQSVIRYEVLQPIQSLIGFLTRKVFVKIKPFTIFDAIAQQSNMANTQAFA